MGLKGVRYYVLRRNQYINRQRWSTSIPVHVQESELRQPAGSLHSALDMLPGFRLASDWLPGGVQGAVQVFER